jgi:dTDP-4-dehydrorhamnose reductase
VPGYTDFVVTSIYVRHLVAIVHELVVTGRRGLVHVASSDALSKFDFGRAVASQFGLSPELVVPTTAPAPHDSPSRTRDLSLATDLLAGWLGSRPATQLEGLRAAYDDEATVPADLRASKETP